MEVEILVNEDDFFKFVTGEEVEKSESLLDYDEDIVYKYKPSLENLKGHPWFDGTPWGA
jgi:hypothetical protein